MKKGFFGIILIMLMPSILFSKDYPGYAVKVNGDTVKGIFPDYNQAQYNPVSIKFTSSANEKIDLTPDNYTYVVVDNIDKYHSFSGPVSISGKYTQEEASLKTFLHQVGESRGVEIYIFNGTARTIAFYKTSSTPVKELVFREKITNSPDGWTSNDYKGQLKEIFSPSVDSTKLNNAIKKLSYIEESFSDFVEELNSPDKESTGNSESGFLFLAGVSFNSFDVKGNNIIPEVSTRYESGISPLFGIGYMFSNIRNTKHNFILMQAKLYEYNNEGSITRANAVYHFKHETDMTISFTLNPGYNIVDKDNLVFFLSPGIGCLGYVGNEMSTKVEMNNGNTIEYSDTGNSLAFNVNVLGGFTFNKKFVLWGTYNIPAETISNQYYTGYHTSVQAGLGYKF